MPKLTVRTKREIAAMSRAEIIDFLEAWGFACYDHESTKELRDCIRSSVQDGSISWHHTPGSNFKYGENDHV